MSKRPLAIEEPGAAASTVPADVAGPVEEAEIAPELKSPVVEVSPPILGASNAHLPDASEVDPSTIKTNTLTKQGWVLPTASTVQANG